VAINKNINHDYIQATAFIKYFIYIFIISYIFVDLIILVIKILFVFNYHCKLVIYILSFTYVFFQFLILIGCEVALGYDVLALHMGYKIALLLPTWCKNTKESDTEHTRSFPGFRSCFILETS